jgi:RHS repeat-associated protein
VYDASGKLVAEYSTQVEPTATAKVSYLTNDHLGSPRILTDQNGQVISRRDFLPFGEEIHSGTGGRTIAQGYFGVDSIRQKFTSYERDNESELEFAQARMHNYNHGRFTSPDPLMSSAKVKNPQTFNRYSYVLNNPLNLIDPLGLLAGCPEGKKCEKDDDGNEYYIEDGKRIYVGGEVGTVIVTAEDTPVTVGYVFPVVPEKVVEKVPWWKQYITRPIGNGAKTAVKTVSRVGGVALFILTNPTSIGCGASPGVVSDGNGGCMKNPTRVDQDTDTETEDKDKLDRNLVIVRGGKSDLPPPGTVFSGAFGATIPDAAAYVPHGQIRTTTVGAIINSGGTVVPVPELTRGGNMNYRHVNITEGPVSTFSPLMPNPVPSKQRIK